MYREEKNDGKTVLTRNKWRNWKKNRLNFSSHGTFKFTIPFGAVWLPLILFCLCHYYSAPKMKQKRRITQREKKKHKKVFYLNLPSKMLPELMKKIKPNALIAFYLQSSSSSSRLAWRAFIWLAFHFILFRFIFCICVHLKEFFNMYKCTLGIAGIGIQCRICTSEAVSHYPYTETSKWSYTLFCTSLRVFVCFFFHYPFHISNVKKWKKSVDFSSFTVQKSRKKSVYNKGIKCKTVLG